MLIKLCVFEVYHIDTLMINIDILIEYKQNSKTLIKGKQVNFTSQRFSKHRIISDLFTVN